MCGGWTFLSTDCHSHHRSIHLSQRPLCNPAACRQGTVDAAVALDAQLLVVRGELESLAVANPLLADPVATYISVREGGGGHRPGGRLVGSCRLRAACRLLPTPSFHPLPCLHRLPFGPPSPPAAPPSPSTARTTSWAPSPACPPTWRAYGPAQLCRFRARWTSTRPWPGRPTRGEWSFVLAGRWEGAGGWGRRHMPHASVPAHLPHSMIRTHPLRPPAASSGYTLPSACWQGWQS